MPQHIEFWFDFSSPYGYLGSRRVEEVAQRHGREVLWRPFLLGAVFKETGQSPLLGQPLRGPYHAKDMPRTARLHGIPFRLPEPFPFPSIAAGRIFYWLEARDPEASVDYAKAVYARAFVEGVGVASTEEAVGVAARLGHDKPAVQGALQDPQVKERLKAATDQAIGKGIFGSPFFIVDGEPFWGHDRLDHVDLWLKTGGW